MPAQEIQVPYRITMPWGYIQIDLNEVTLVSTVEDPPKIRMGATAGGSLGAFSFGRVRADGIQDEVVLIQGKIDERFRSVEEGGLANHTTLVGEVRVDLRAPSAPEVPDDAQFVPVLRLLHDKIVAYVPLVTAAGDPVKPVNQTSVFFSDDGRYVYNVQGDPTEEYPYGRIVQYDTTHPAWGTDHADKAAVAILKPFQLL